MARRAAPQYHMAGRNASRVRDGDNVPSSTRASLITPTVLLPVDGGAAQGFFARELRIAESGSGEVLDSCDVRWAAALPCAQRASRIGMVPVPVTRAIGEAAKRETGKCDMTGQMLCPAPVHPGLPAFHLARREISSKVTDRRPLCSVFSAQK